MKLNGTVILILLFSFVLSVNETHSSEIGFSIGSSYRASDILQPISFLPAENYIEQEGTIFTITTGGKSDENPFGHRVGALYLDFIYVNPLPREGFELEHNVYASFGAGESVRKHVLGYSANVNYVTPWYPEIMVWRMKPFIGAGAGYAYLFGENKYFLPRASLGNQGELHFSIGGGVKIHVHKQWWLRLTARDNISPRMTRLDRQELSNIEDPYQLRVETMSYYPVRRVGHHISIFFSLVKSDKEEGDEQY